MIWWAIFAGLTDFHFGAKVPNRAPILQTFLFSIRVHLLFIFGARFGFLAFDSFDF